MPITDLGMAGITAGQSIVNQGLGMINQDRQAKINKEQAKYQQGLDKEMAKYTYDLTNTSALMKQLKSNDLNPTLALAGGGAAGGQTVSTGNSGTQGVGMIENKISFAEAMQMSLLDAQKKNIEADTKLKEADANKTSGVDTELAGAEIKILEATVDKIGEEIKNFGVQRELMSLEMSVKRGEIDKIAQEIQNLKASKELTEQQKESLIISTAQSVLTQKMQRAVMRGELKLLS